MGQFLQSSPCSQCYYAFLSYDSCKSISWSRDQKTRNPPPQPLKTVILSQCELLRLATPCRLSLHPYSFYSPFIFCYTDWQDKNSAKCTHPSRAYGLAFSSGERDEEKSLPSGKAEPCSPASLVNALTPSNNEKYG